MSNIEPKMLSQTRIYNILEKYSDESHPMTQAAIADKLEEVYGIKMERKAIGKKLANLKEAGYDIRSCRKGCYLGERLFDDSELHFLIDSIYGNRIINQKHTEDLIEKLRSLSNIYFKPRINKMISLGNANKGDNPALFLNIDLIYEAILKGLMIKYDYNLYGTDKKLHKTSTQIVSPYQLLFHQQGYYLMAYCEHHAHMVFHKIDHMTNMEITADVSVPIKKISGYERGLPQNYFTAARPYMYSDDPERITMAVSKDPYVINQIVEWFGKDISIGEFEESNEYYKVSVVASPQAMRLWALQYADHVEILQPYDLRESVKQSLTYAFEKYGGYDG